MARSTCYLTLTPTSLAVSDVEVDGGIVPSSSRPVEPMRVIELWARSGRRVTPESVRQMDLVATKDGPVWVVQLDSTAAGLSPPLQYTVGYGTDDVVAGGPLPEPLTQ